LVRINATFSIDHEVKAAYIQIVGNRHASDDLEEYMKSRVEEWEKIKNLVAPDQRTTNINSDLSSNFELNSNLKSVTVHQEKNKLDVLNMSKPELSATIDKIEDIQTLARAKGNAHTVVTIAKTRIQRLR
jgi:hypothetical protein